MVTKRLIVTAGLVLALSVAACDRDPAAPALGPDPGAVTASQQPGNRVRPERLARRFARALRNPAFRAYIRAQLEASPVVEHKLHFQRFLRANNARALAALAGENGELGGDVAADADSGQAFEFYFPVPAHRARWTGDENVLVATVVEDRDVPVAFDTRGRRVLLSGDAPPATPVIALVPVETDFDAAPPVMGAQACLNPEDCSSGGGNTPPPPPSGGGTVASGLYMTAAQFGHDYEGWLKGNPEMEVHVMGQIGSTDSMTSYQCAGEHAGGPYAYDMNGTAWTGNVLLFSQTQLNQYKGQHPGNGVRVLFVEDDDGACQLRFDGVDVVRAITYVTDFYSGLTGGRDSSLIGTTIRYFKAVNSGFALLRDLGNLIQTKDEYIGIGVEDDVVGQTYPGFNWFVKGPSNISNGWVNLVIR